MSTPVVPTVSIEVELSGSGAGWTVLTDALKGVGLKIRHGIQGSGPTDLVASTGTATFTLKNDATNSGLKQGYYSLYHANKRTGWALGIGCRIRLTDPTTLTVWTRFQGRIDEINPTAGRYGEQQVRVTAVDWIDEAARWALSPSIMEQVNQRGDLILQAIVAQMPSQPVATSYDAGHEAYPYALDTSAYARQPALSEFGKLATSELGPIYVKANGTLRYESRYQRMLDTTSDWTIGDTDLRGLTLPSKRDEIINTVRTITHGKIVDALPTTIVYDQSNVIALGASASKTLLGPFRDPVTGEEIGATAIQPCTATTDYLANTAADGTGANVTSSLSVTVTSGSAGAQFVLTNGTAATMYVTQLQLRGKGVYDHGTTQHQARNTTSITSYGERVVSLDMSYQDNDEVGQGAADYLLAKFKDPLAQVRTITVLGNTAAKLTQLLTRDISDRLTISETLTGVSGSFYINAVELRVLPSGYLEGTYTLATATNPFGSVFVLEVSALNGADGLAGF